MSYTRRMIIAIDIREAAEQKSGKSRYTYNVVMAMIMENQDVSFVLYARETNKDFCSFKNVECVNIHKRGMFWHSAVVRDWKKRVTEGNKDSAYNKFAFFAPTSFIIPFLLPKELTSVVTVHDLIAFKEKTHQKKAALIEKVFAGRALRKAAQVLTPSLNTAHDLAMIFPYTKDKISITPLGVDSTLFADTEENSTKTKPDNREKIILTVGGLEPRKNISTLVDAFLTLPNEFNDYTLQIIGGNGWNSQKLLNKIASHSNRISHLQTVKSEDLPNYYRTATIFVFPSLYEGFGLPPLEAMACSTPVACSNSSSLPEVCGVCALLFKTQSVSDIREKIIMLLKDKEMRDSLSATGLEHAKKFTWKKCAALTMESIKAASKQ